MYYIYQSIKSLFQQRNSKKLSQEVAQDLEMGLIKHEQAIDPTPTNIYEHDIESGISASVIKKQAFALDQSQPTWYRNLYYSGVASAKSAYGIGVVFSVITSFFVSDEKFNKTIAVPAMSTLLSLMSAETLTGAWRGSQGHKIEHTNPFTEIVLEPSMALLILAASTSSSAALIAITALAPILVGINGLKTDKAGFRQEVSLHKPIYMQGRNQADQTTKQKIRKHIINAVQILMKGLMSGVSTAGYVSFIFNASTAAVIYGALRGIIAATLTLLEKSALESGHSLDEIQQKVRVKLAQKASLIETAELGFYENLIVLSWILVLFTGDFNEDQDLVDIIRVAVITLLALPSSFASYKDASRILAELMHEQFSPTTENQSDVENPPAPMPSL